MKLRADIAGESYSVDFRRYGHRVVTEIDDRRYELYVHESGPQEFLLIHDGRVFDCRVEGRPEIGKAIDVIVGTKRCAIAITDPKRLQGAVSTAAYTDEAARIIAPMPGRIVRVLVELGNQVETGVGIVVVEAMNDRWSQTLKSFSIFHLTIFICHLGVTLNSRSGTSCQSHPCTIHVAQGENIEQ